VIRIVASGVATTVQDLGRPGWAHLGVGRAGAVDPTTLRSVNRLVGNPEWCAGLETAGGVEIEALVPLVTADSVRMATTALSPGQRLSVPHDPQRTWAYLAVRGGILAPVVLGSASRDTVASIGPPPVRTGDELEVDRDPGTPLHTDHAPRPVVERPVRLWPGPRPERTAPAWQALLGATWVVRSDVSRVGVRLDGPSIALGDPSWASEALVPGAVQVPPDGRPFVMLADHPVTGGYPVVGVVDPDDLVVVAQARPGRRLTFRPAVT
jgi:biotin-dependent carboxylase-like uncharacterized protein